MTGLLRNPSTETSDYPGLFVHDGRVTGSITFDQSRLPLWCLVATAITDGWDVVTDNWPSVTDYGWDAPRFGAFLYYLLECRGEFGRLLCILADAERQEYTALEENADALPWYQHPEQKQRVIEQLKRCLNALNTEEPRI